MVPLLPGEEVSPRDPGDSSVSHCGLDDCSEGIARRQELHVLVELGQIGGAPFDRDPM
jgi:hypothetical protein